MSNFTDSSTFSSAPSCALHPRSSILSGISDHTLGVILPTLIYIIGSLFFHIVNELELFSNYRIHPPKEELHRNRVSKLGCLLVVIRYHVIQIVIGLLLTYNNGPELVEIGGCETYQWVRRIRKCLTVIPWALTPLGLDTQGLMSKFSKTPLLAHFSANSHEISPSPTFTALEWNLARIIVSFAVPAIQFFVYLAVVDTWIYFMHRLCHINKTLYRMYRPLFWWMLSTRIYLIENSSRDCSRSASWNLRSLCLWSRIRPLARNSLLGYLELCLSKCHFRNFSSSRNDCNVAGDVEDS